MKNLKLFLFLFCTVLAVSFSIVSCEKNAANDVAIESDYDVEEFDDSNIEPSEIEPIELEERGTEVFTIDSIRVSSDPTVGSPPHSFINNPTCGKYAGYARIEDECYFEMSGKGFGTVRDSLKLYPSIDKTVYEEGAIELTSITDTKIKGYFIIPDYPRLKNVTINVLCEKFIKKIVGKDTTRFKKTKKKGMKAIGCNPANDESGISTHYAYGTSIHYVLQKRLLSGTDLNDLITLMSHAKSPINESFSPVVGDIVFDTDGEPAIILQISPIIKVSQKNKLCTSKIKTITVEKTAAGLVPKNTAYKSFTQYKR